MKNKEQTIIRDCILITNEKYVEPKQLRRRITKETQSWQIAIDDGYVSYVFPLKVSNKYSIISLFERIQKSVRKN